MSPLIRELEPFDRGVPRVELGASLGDDGRIDTGRADFLLELREETPNDNGQSFGEPDGRTHR